MPGLVQIKSGHNDILLSNKIDLIVCSHQETEMNGFPIHSSGARSAVAWVDHGGRPIGSDASCI